MSVREATDQDLPQVLELVREFLASTVHSCVPFIDGRAAGLINDCIHNPNMCAFVWEPQPGVMKGVYLGRVSSWWYAEELCAFDLAFYINPAHRGAGGAAQLFIAFRDWATAKGARTSWPGTSSGIELDRSTAFYLGQGMQKVGDVFMGKLP